MGRSQVVMVRAVRLFVLVLAIVPASGVAWSAPSKSPVSAARKAVDELRYEDARVLLVDALKQGDHSPTELAEIYRLSASTAYVLKEPEVAEQFYRKLLIIEPDAKLPPDASPGSRGPFVAAQAYVAAHRKLEVRATITGDRLDVTIEGDSMAMISGAIALRGNTTVARGTLEGGTTTLRISGGAEIDEVAAIDEFGNRVILIEPTTKVVPRPEAVRQPVPIIRRWTTWAIPTAISGAVAIGFGIDAQRTHARLDTILQNSESYYYAEAESARKRWKRDTLIRDISLVATGAFAVTAAIMLATEPKGVLVTPTAGSGEVGVAVTAAW